MSADFPHIELYASGDPYFQMLRRNIREAQREILLESYILDFDPIGQAVLKELADAVRRGVRVRLMVDGVGSFNWLKSIEEYCRKNQIALRVYHPIPFQIFLSQRLSWRSLRRLLILFRQSNRRNHRKVLITDESRVLLGSLNISQVHSERLMGAQAWRDTGALIDFSRQEKPLDVEILRRAFLKSWQEASWRSFFRKDRRSNQPQRTLFRLNDGMRKRRGISRNLKRRLRGARSRILITTPYFLPRRSHFLALLGAAKRGVFVGVLLPQKTDVRVVQLASRVLYRKMLESGIHLFEYTPRILHAKTLVIDDWGTVGSANFNHRSFLHDLEVELVVKEPHLLSSLVAQWDEDVLQAKKIDLENLNLSLWDMLLGKIISWFRYWL